MRSRFGTYIRLKGQRSIPLPSFFVFIYLFYRKDTQPHCKYTSQLAETSATRTRKPQCFLSCSNLQSQTQTPKPRHPRVMFGLGFMKPPGRIRGFGASGGFPFLFALLQTLERSLLRETPIQVFLRKDIDLATSTSAQYGLFTYSPTGGPLSFYLSCPSGPTDRAQSSWTEPRKSHWKDRARCVLLFFSLFTRFTWTRDRPQEGGKKGNPNQRGAK